MNPNTNIKPNDTQPNNDQNQAIGASNAQPQPQQPGPAPQMQFAPGAKQLPSAPTPTKKSKKLIVILIVVFLLLASAGLYVLLAGSDDNTQTTTTPSTQANTADSDEELAGFSTTQTATNNDEILADANLRATHGELESYFAENGNYPSTVSSKVMPNADPTIFEIPGDLSLTYTPKPKACTTEAKDCVSYTLMLSRPDGSIISTKESLNN